MDKRFIFATSLTVVTLSLGIAAYQAFGTDLLLPADAASSRTMTFDSSHRSITTANGNKFETYWINKVNGSASPSSGYLAYLEGTATWNTYSESYSQTNPKFGIRGSYNFAKATKVVVAYKVSTSWTDCDMVTITSSGANGSYYSICSTYTSSNTVESTKTFTISSTNLKAFIVF